MEWLTSARLALQALAPKVVWGCLTTRCLKCWDWPMKQVKHERNCKMAQIEAVGIWTWVFSQLGSYCRSVAHVFCHAHRWMHWQARASLVERHWPVNHVRRAYSKISPDSYAVNDVKLVRTRMKRAAPLANSILANSTHGGRCRSFVKPC